MKLKVKEKEAYAYETKHNEIESDKMLPCINTTSRMYRFLNANRHL